MYLLRYPKSIIFTYVVFAAAVLAFVLVQGSRHIRSEVAVAMASTYADSITTFREYYSSVVVTRANEAGLLASHRYMEEANAIPNPATLAIELGRELSTRRLETGFRFFSDYPFVTRADGGPNDEFERAALQALSNGARDSYTQWTMIDGRDVLRHAVPVNMSVSCVACHNSHEDSPKTDWQVGDIRGVQSVALFLPPIDPVGNSGYYLMLLGSVGAIFCLFGFLYIKVQRFVRHEQRIVDRQEAEKYILSKEKEAAEEANASKTLFLSNVSHELRTPLNAIIGFSEMIKTQALGTIDKPRYVEYAADIHRSGQHLLSLINDLLDMNRIEAGKFELYPQEIDVDKLTIECCDLIRGEAEKGGRGIEAGSRSESAATQQRPACHKTDSPQYAVQCREIYAGRRSGDAPDFLRCGATAGHRGEGYRHRHCARRSGEDHEALRSGPEQPIRKAPRFGIGTAADCRVYPIAWRSF